MSLPAKLATLDGLDEIVAKEYEKVGEEYVLQVEKVGGLGLEDVGGMKSTIENLRSEKKTLEKEVKTISASLQEHREKFAEIDPVAAKEAMEKVKEVANWDGDTKIREAVAAAVQESENKHKERVADLLAKHNEKVDGINQELNGSQEQLRNALVTSKIVEAILKEKGNVDLLMPHVERQVQMNKTEQGEWLAQVLNKDGKVRIGDAAANTDMTISELVAEMKADTVYAPCFAGTGSTGSGGPSGDKKDSKPVDKDTGKKKHIRADDQDALNANFEKIASGDVIVDPVE